MQESKVLTCKASDCSYNCDLECCAPTIEVGDDHPKCDMYTTADVKIVSGEPPVSMCKVDDCHYNSSMMCNAAAITMMQHADHADCATFRM